MVTSRGFTRGVLSKAKRSTCTARTSVPLTALSSSRCAMTAFEQGYAAFLKGMSRDENPFDEETCSFSLKRWVDGWNKAYRARQEKQT